MLTKNMGLAVFIILFSIAAYAGSISYPHPSAYFPRFIIIFMGCLGCIMMIQEIRNRVKTLDREQADAGPSGSPAGAQAVRKVVMMIVSSVVFLLILSEVGFFSAIGHSEAILVLEGESRQHEQQPTLALDRFNEFVHKLIGVIVRAISCRAYARVTQQSVDAGGHRAHSFGEGGLFIDL